MSTKVLLRRQARQVEQLVAFYFTIVYYSRQTNSTNRLFRRLDYKLDKNIVGLASSNKRLLVELQRKLQLTNKDSSKERAVTLEKVRKLQIRVVIGITRAVTLD